MYNICLVFLKFTKNYNFFFIPLNFSCDFLRRMSSFRKCNENAASTLELSKVFLCFKALPDVDPVKTKTRMGSQHS